MHCYRDLLGHPRGPRAVEKLARAHGPGDVRSPFRHTWHLAGHPHRSLLMGPRYEDYLTDIFQHGAACL